MSRSLLPRLGAVVLAALVLPACGNDTPTIGDAARAVISVSVDPNPVPPSQNLLTGAVSIGYRITIASAGLGGELQFVASQVFDPANGQLVSLTYFDSDDLVVFVGKKRVEAGDTLVVPQTGSYILPDLSTSATLTVNVQMKDDKDNIINQSVLVKIETPAVTPS
jgi:hypothetical protein